jgi:putative protein-disulfide isomerase
MYELAPRMHATKPRILYIADPLCGWCYAFGSALNEMVGMFSDRCEFHVVMGGMITGDRQGPIGNTSSYILSALPRLEQTTGVVMGEPFKAMLREGTRWSSSVLPSKAVVAFRLLVPEKAIDFLFALQHAHFQQGSDLNDPSLYSGIAASFGVDEELFTLLLADERITEITDQDFAMVTQWGISGFPSLAAEVGTRFYGITHGYRNAADLEKLFDAVLQVDPTSA